MHPDQRACLHQQQRVRRRAANSDSYAFFNLLTGPELLEPVEALLRELYTGGKMLMTTLLCPKQTSKASLKGLYRDRWHVELDLRIIKTTLGMERLSCRTPMTVQKEIWVYLLAYNLIRLLMAQSVLLAEMLPRQLSFKHTLQIWIAWRQSGTGSDDDKLAGLFILIARQHVGNRPGRIKPRAVKRRPKPFPLLTKPRPVAKQEIQLYGHPKKLRQVPFESDPIDLSMPQTATPRFRRCAVPPLPPSPSL